MFQPDLSNTERTMTCRPAMIQELLARLGAYIRDWRFAGSSAYRGLTGTSPSGATPEGTHVPHMSPYAGKLVDSEEVLLTQQDPVKGIRHAMMEHGQQECALVGAANTLF